MIILLNTQWAQDMSYYYYLQFIENEMEAKWCLVTCPEATFGAGILTLGSTVFNHSALLTCFYLSNSCLIHSLWKERDI